MKESRAKFLRIIIAVASVIVCILIWTTVIPLPEGWKEIPVALLNLLAAPIYALIEYLTKKGGEGSKGNVHFVQAPGSIMSNVHVGDVHNDPALINDLVDTRVKLALSESEVAIWKENYLKLEAKYANKDQLPGYEQTALKLLKEDKIDEAIESVDTDADGAKLADKLKFKAELLIVAFRFDEAGQHYEQAATIFPSYDNNFAAAYFYDSLNQFPKAIAYYERCLPLANSPEQRAGVLNNMGSSLDDLNEHPQALKAYEEALAIRRQLADKNPQAYQPYVAMTLNNLGVLYDDLNDHPQALAAYEEALKVYKKLAAANPQAYLPDVAMTLNNLAMFYQDDQPNKEVSLRYAHEAVEVLGKCNDTPEVRRLLEQDRRIIARWKEQ